MSVFKSWRDRHPDLWEFILFNILSNISTVTRFVMTWVGAAVFVSGLALTRPFSFLIFDYTSANSGGLGGFLTFLLAEVLAQVVNFFVQKLLHGCPALCRACRGDRGGQSRAARPRHEPMREPWHGERRGRNRRERGEYRARGGGELSHPQVLGHAEGEVRGCPDRRGAGRRPRARAVPGPREWMRGRGGLPRLSLGMPPRSQVVGSSSAIAESALSGPASIFDVRQCDYSWQQIVLTRVRGYGWLVGARGARPGLTRRRRVRTRACTGQRRGATLSAGVRSLPVRRPWSAPLRWERAPLYATPPCSIALSTRRP